MPNPKPKGRIMPANPTERATFQLEVNMRMSTSRATRNRKMMRPRLATLLKTGMDSLGKMAVFIQCQ